MILMITGHRQILPYNHSGSPYPENPTVYQHHQAITSVLTNIVHQYARMSIDIGDGVASFISGMAIGADQLFALAVIAAQDMGIDVKLIAAVPFAGQESKWPAASQEQYNSILARASQIVHVCEPGYVAWKMQKRNEWMVNNCTNVLAVWDGKRNGGTFNCLRYAVNKGKPVWQLHPQSFTFTNVGSL